MENTEQSWLIFLLGAAALHGCWLAILLFFKNRPNGRVRLLGTTMILLSLYLINYLLYLTEAIYYVPHAVGAFYPITFLIGPTFYFFVKSFLQPEFYFKEIHLLHLTPFFLSIIMTGRLYAAPVEYKLKLIDWFLHPDGSFTWWDMIRGNDFTYHIIAYILAAYLLAKKVESIPLKKEQTKWLRQFSFVFLWFMILQLIFNFFAFALNFSSFTFEYVLAAITAIGIHIVGYHTLGQIKLQPISTEKNTVQNGEKDGNGKYKTSPLTHEQIIVFKNKLLQLMEMEKPHLNTNLKISELANLIGLPSHHLSQILNEGMQTSYYDFINQYRIKLAQEKLIEEKYRHYSILAIGMECGFTNKTTFNRAFKKITGMTPSEYMGKNMEIK